MARELDLEAYIDLLHRLSPEEAEDLGRYLAPEARHRDPLSDVRGVPAIVELVHNLFRVCREPDLQVVDWALDGDLAYIEWTFTDQGQCSGARGPLSVGGVSRLRFGPDGRVREHIGYWDPAVAVYERVPVVGAFIRFLRRRLAPAC